MTPTETYKEVRDAAAKDAIKAVLIFFVAVPIALFVIIYAIL